MEAKIIEIPQNNLWYQSAFAFTLPPLLNKYVLDMRQRINIRSKEIQMTPHLTILFLGNHKGGKMLEVYKMMQPLLNKTISVEIIGIGYFEKDGKINNIHLKIKPNQKLLNFQNAALKKYSQTKLQSQTKYIGELFCPHISIFNDIEITQRLYNSIQFKLPKIKTVKLLNPVFFIKNLPG